MYQFLKKALLFLGFGIFMFTTVFCFFSIMNKTDLEQYKLKLETADILIGDSHVENGLNDDALKGFVNLAHYAESYYLSYYKLKLLLEHNPQIQNVYLGYSFHNLSNYYDDFISGKYANAVSSEYFFILPLFEQAQCMFWNLQSLSTYMNKSFEYGYKNLVDTNNVSFMGGYQNSYFNTFANVPAIDRRINAQFYKDGDIREFSSINLDYLNRIIKLCKLEDIDLYFMNMPLQQYYRMKLPEVYIHKYHEIINDNHIQVIDLSNLTLKDDCFMVDGDHVSKKGAQQTTKYFLDYILMNKMHKRLYDEY